VAFLLTCAPLGRAVVNFGDDESSDLTSNIIGLLAEVIMTQNHKIGNRGFPADPQKEPSSSSHRT
jgi:hypothetical protein